MAKIDVIEFITTVRASCNHSIATYTQGNCFGFYTILKSVFPEAEPYETGGHVITKIDDKYYDIRGEVDFDAKLIIDEGLHDHNIWSDERRKEYAKEYAKELIEKSRDRGNPVTYNEETGRIELKEDKNDN